MKKIIVIIISIILVVGLCILMFKLGENNEPKKIVIPDVTNLTKEKAITKISDLGLQVEVVEEESELEVGTIISVNPKIGSEVSLDTIVIITVAKEKENPYVGTYKQKVNDGSVPVDLILNEDYTFKMGINLCEGIATIEGTYEVTDTRIKLSFEPYQYSGFDGDDNTSYTFDIIDDDLKFISDLVCCGPNTNEFFEKQ